MLPILNFGSILSVTKYLRKLKWDTESKKMRFFDINNLPKNQNTPDLIDIYRRSLSRTK